MIFKKNFGRVTAIFSDLLKMKGCGLFICKVSLIASLKRPKLCTWTPVLLSILRSWMLTYPALFMSWNNCRRNDEAGYFFGRPQPDFIGNSCGFKAAQILCPGIGICLQAQAVCSDCIDDVVHITTRLHGIITFFCETSLFFLTYFRCTKGLWDNFYHLHWRINTSTRFTHAYRRRSLAALAIDFITGRNQMSELAVEAQLLTRDENAR